MKLIPLTQGRFAIVDDDDYEWLMQWKWVFKKDGYARRNIKINQKYKTLFMHREINKTPEKMQTDHINGDRLDNRKLNLRSCTSKENQGNASKRKGLTSKFKGVCFNSRYNRWCARIGINLKGVYIGCFINELDAAKAYNKKAIEHFGEFAKLNDVDTNI